MLATSTNRPPQTPTELLNEYSCMRCIARTTGLDEAPLPHGGATPAAASPMHASQPHAAPIPSQASAEEGAAAVPHSPGGHASTAAAELAPPTVLPVTLEWRGLTVTVAAGGGKREILKVW